MMAVVTYSLPPVVPSGHHQLRSFIQTGNLTAGYIFQRQKTRDSKIHDCNFGVNVEGWSGERIERVICVDPPLPKRICSAGREVENNFNTAKIKSHV